MINLAYARPLLTKPNTIWLMLDLTYTYYCNDRELSGIVYLIPYREVSKLGSFNLCKSDRFKYCFCNSNCLFKVCYLAASQGSFLCKEELQFI